MGYVNPQRWLWLKSIKSPQTPQLLIKTAIGLHAADELETPLRLI